MTKPTYVSGDVPTATEVNEFMVNIRCAVKSSAESVTSSTTLQDDDTLTVTVLANATYIVEMVLLYDGATTGDLKIQFSLPASATVEGWLSQIVSTGSTTDADLNTRFVNGASNTLGCAGAGTTVTARATGVLVTAGTAGSFTLQWAQGTSDGTATRVLANSFLSLRRVS